MAQFSVSLTPLHKSPSPQRSEARSFYCPLPQPPDLLASCAAMGGVVIDSYAAEKDIELTVDADTVNFPDGRPLYRIRRGRGQICLTDANNQLLLILRRKVLSIRRRWEGFAGRGQEDGNKPIFSVRRSLMIGRFNLSAEVYRNNIAGKFRVKKGAVEGRSFTVQDIANKAVGADIRRDLGGGGGENLVTLSVRAGFDSAFAVALAIVLEQIGGGDI